MNIKEFKDGDIITRNAPMTYAHNGSADGSYTGDRIIFVGVDDVSKVIVLKCEIFGVTTLSYARDGWNEGWAYYPETLFQKAKKIISKKK